MAKIIKKIVKKPQQLRKERERWISMERVINAGLRRINPQYRIWNLVRHRNGTIEFESSVEFDPAHRKQIEHLLSLLHTKESEFVQAKLYLPQEIWDKVKHKAIDLDVRNSSLVAAILAEEL